MSSATCKFYDDFLQAKGWGGGYNHLAPSCIADVMQGAIRLNIRCSISYCHACHAGSLLPVQHIRIWFLLRTISQFSEFIYILLIILQFITVDLVSIFFKIILCLNDYN